MNKNNILSIFSGLVLLFGISIAQAESPLEGAWIVSSWEQLGDQAIGDPQPGIFVFTSTNYAIMYASTDESRPAYDRDVGQTDEQKLAAYDSLTANAGGYEMDGNTFTTFAYVAKDTTYMADFPENGVEYGFERDGETLTLTRESGPTPFKVVLERVEGEDGPWETE